jgi:hypothetical protein
MEGNPFAAFFAPDSQLQQLLTRLQLEQQQQQQQQQQRPIVAGGSGKRCRDRFTAEEDELLRTVVTQMGTSDWNAVALRLRNRTARQCRDRWKHYVAPDVVTGVWTDGEDQTLLAKVAEIGPKWSLVAQALPGRTGVGIKNHYLSLTGRKNRGLDAPPRSPSPQEML